MGTEGKKSLQQLITYTAVGAAGTLTHYAVLLLLVEGLGTGAALASSSGAVAGAMVNYFLNFHWTFRDQDYNHRHAAPRFFAVALFGFFLNMALVYLGTELWLVHYLISQLIATAAVLLSGFIINKLWTFEQS